MELLRPTALYLGASRVQPRPRARVSQRCACPIDPVAQGSAQRRVCATVREGAELCTLELRVVRVGSHCGTAARCTGTDTGHGDVRGSVHDVPNATDTPTEMRNTLACEEPDGS